MGREDAVFVVARWLRRCEWTPWHVLRSPMLGEVAMLCGCRLPKLAMQADEVVLGRAFVGAWLDSVWGAPRVCGSCVMMMRSFLAGGEVARSDLLVHAQIAKYMAPVSRGWGEAPWDEFGDWEARVAVGEDPEARRLLDYRSVRRAHERLLTLNGRWA